MTETNPAKNNDVHRISIASHLRRIHTATVLLGGTLFSCRTGRRRGRWEHRFWNTGSAHGRAPQVRVLWPGDRNDGDGVWVHRADDRGGRSRRDTLSAALEEEPQGEGATEIAGERC